MRMLVRFGKRARLRFISHLDLQRFMQMALNRTGLPVQFSQGFNPHPLMSFASALALGWTSEYEVLDVRLAAPMGRGRCEAAMRAALPEDLPVYGVRLVDDRAPAAMAMVCASDYHVSLAGGGAGALLEAIPGFLADEHVMAVKKSKAGEREVDIRPAVLKLTAAGDGFDARLMLTEKQSLKADLLARALAERAGETCPEVRVHRTALLGRDAAGELHPLMEL